MHGLLIITRSWHDKVGGVHAYGPQPEEEGVIDESKRGGRAEKKRFSSKAF